MTALPSTAAGAPATLRLPAADRPASPDALRELRRFHLGGAVDAATVAAPANDLLPALLAPFQRPERVRSDFPLFVPAAGDATCQPFADLLAAVTAGAGDARLLRDNLLRLERRVRVCSNGAVAEDAGALLRRAGAEMVAELQLRDASAAELRRELDAVAAALPVGSLLPLDPTTPILLLAAAARSRRARARRAFAARAGELAQGLRNLLRVDAGKDQGARDAAGIGRSLGGAGDRFLDPAALARSVGPHRGTQALAPERRRRLDEALAVLQVHLTRAVGHDLEIVDDGSGEAIAGVACSEAADPCAAAAVRFDAVAAELLATVRAARLAELELRSAYVPDRHDPMLAAMDWQALSADELALLPTIAAVVHGAQLRAVALPALTRLLVSGRPVQVLALAAATDDPQCGDDANLLAHRLELGYLGIAFREVFVQQSTAARPQHLEMGFRKALAGARPGLHVVAAGVDHRGDESPLGAFLHAGAAIEGRAHPLFHYDPANGDTWAARLHFAHNPSPDADWPASELECVGPGGAGARLQLAFTFADFALLEPGLRHCFRPVDDALQSEDLVPVAEHLQLHGDDAARAVPFVWAADRDGGLHRLAVARSLLQACRDRLRYWRTLQELAGVKNEYVREAVRRARQEAADEAQQQRQALAAQHRTELAAARDVAAGAAMQGLARMLLELGPLDLPPAPAPAPAAAVAPAPSAPAVPAVKAAVIPAAPPKAAAAPVVDDDLDEPWIDTPRCSTCNDCVNLNSLMFGYDANKQAVLKDARAGSYAQLVQAAEKCPAHCIHPGKPLDPNEAGLDDLVRRAAPFR